MAVEFLSRGKFALPVSRECVEENWRGRGYDCHVFVDPPGRAWNDFVHETNELVTVIEGRLEMTVGDQVVVAEPGDEVFIPSGVSHSVANIHTGATYWLFGYD